MRPLTGFSAGIITGYLLGFVLPLKIFMIVCLVVAALAGLVFFLFHLGVRDFQEYEEFV